MTTVEFNPFDSALLNDPYPVYAALRETGAVTPVSLMGGAACAVSRHAEVTACLRRHGDFSSDVMAFGAVGDRSLIGSDPPDHTVLRRMVTRPFHPAAIAALQPRITAIADDLVASMLNAADGGEADLVKQLAEPLPVIVIAELLGIPPERRDDFKRWSDAFVGVGTVMTGGADGGTALAEMASYFDEVIRDRRRNPGDDLISVLATGAEPLSDGELLGFCILLLVAGNETTTNLLGNAMSAVLAHPDQLERLRTDPDLIPAAIEEVLRYDPPVQFLFRRARTTVELGEQQIRENEFVLVLFASANRDERKYPNPDCFDIGRDTRDHLGFGAGIHLCLGAPLARLEARVALETLIRRTSDIAAAEPAKRAPHMFLRGFSEFPLALRPA